MAPTWDTRENAALYAEYCQRFPKYHETSSDLVELLPVATSRLVVDLACGTGATTEVILRSLPVDGRVVAVDAASAMLDIASEAVPDPRVNWIRARAEELSEHMDEPADLVLCNSAIWQMDMPAVLRDVRRILHPRGGFAFNIGREFMVLPLTDEELNPRAPSLFQLMQAAAVLYHGFAPPMLGQRGRPLTMDSVQSMLHAAGFNLEQKKIIEHAESYESQRAWLSIPVFTERQFGSLPYERRMEALGEAYERLDGRSRSSSRWAVFVARAR